MLKSPGLLRGWTLGIVFAIACFVGSEARASGSQPSKGPGTPLQTIFVASNGWHSAIFVSRETLTPDYFPEITDFPTARYIGFGWGDAAYFPDRDPGFITLLRAALLPTKSVIHVTGLRLHPRAAYSNDEVVAVRISRKGLKSMLTYLSNSFARSGVGRGKRVAPGLDPDSYFYNAKGEFHVFNTCNSWTARALAAAGVPMDPEGLFRAESLMSQLRALSTAKTGKGLE